MALYSCMGIAASYFFSQKHALERVISLSKGKKSFRPTQAKSKDIKRGKRSFRCFFAQARMRLARSSGGRDMSPRCIHRAMTWLGSWWCLLCFRLRCFRCFWLQVRRLKEIKQFLVLRGEWHHICSEIHRLHRCLLLKLLSHLSWFPIDVARHKGVGRANGSTSGPRQREKGQSLEKATNLQLLKPASLDVH